MFIDKAVSGLGELTPAKLAEASTYNLNPKVKYNDEALGIEHFKALSPERKAKYAYRFQQEHEDLVNDGKLGPLTVAKLISEAKRVSADDYSNEASVKAIDDMWRSYPKTAFDMDCGTDGKDSCYIHGVLPFHDATVIKPQRRRPKPGPTPPLDPVPLPEPLEAGGPNIAMLALGGALLFAAYRSFQGKPILPGMK